MAERSMVKVSANFTDKTVQMKNFETADEELCSPNDVGIQKYLFVPWAASESDYKKNRKLAVGFTATGGGPDYRFWLWENSGIIYYNTSDSWKPDADKVPGDSDGGWWKALTIRHDGLKYTIALSTIPS